MNQLEFQRNHLQMDYYSESYQDFERDFYRYSNMNIPLTFLTDDNPLIYHYTYKKTTIYLAEK